MTSRYCVCGKSIWYTKTLCDDCSKKYGNDRSKWDQYLVEWARSMDKEYKQESRHRHLQLFEETETGNKIPLSSDAVHNLNMAMDNPEMEFEDFIWDNV